MNLKQCPFSDKHRVYGGHPVFVCSQCGTEWTVDVSRNKCQVIYIHFNYDGVIKKTWKVPLAS